LSITGTIFSTFSIYTIIFSFFFNNEHLLPIQWIFIGVTIIGTLIVSLPHRFHPEELKKRSFIIWALVGAILNGFADALSKQIIDRSSLGTFLFAMAFIQIPIGLAYLALEKQKLSSVVDILKHYRSHTATFVGSFFDITGTLCMYLAFQQTLASIASPIFATSPVIVILLSLFILKDKISRKDAVGLALSILGIIGISFV
jgi:drug/metabolite transporter (DMT)-like permease